MDITPEQLRICENLSLAYAQLLDAQRDLRARAKHMRWKAVGGRQYLYQTPADSAVEISAGAHSPSTIAEFDAWEQARREILGRIAGAEKSVAETISQYRALALPQIDPMPARIARELDVRGLLGTDFFLVGTNAFSAYEIEARERFVAEYAATNDTDLAWARGSHASLGNVKPGVGSPLLMTLRHIDSSYRMGDRRYKAVNNDAYEVELLAAPSVIRNFQEGETFSPVPLPEQEWLLRGRPVRHVVVATDRSPAPIVAPDPRWMALHKIWLSRKESRAATKKDKDAAQGVRLLSAVARKMSDTYPLDTDFVLELPPELLPIFNEWATANSFVPGNSTDKPRWF